MGFSNLWRTRDSEKNADSEKNTTNVPFIRDDSKKEGETYLDYGKRVCGLVTAQILALTPYLNKINNEEQREQRQNQEIQERLKETLRQEKSEVESEITKKEAHKSGIELKICDAENKKKELELKLIEAKEKDGETNKMEKIKLIIGCVIISFLTVYLFIFYGSTFYSAFLYQPTDDGSLTLGSAMLNARAFGESLDLGMGPFIFVITAPIIFLGLGYSLHYFMIQKGGVKWFKIGVLLFITLSFDCILAYKIGELMYNYMILTQLTALPPFSFDIAISDINFWAVIFCGFIVYLIWGIVFDMIMSAYEGLRSNKQEIDSFNLAILNTKNEIAQLKQDKIAAEGQIEKLNLKKISLVNRINNSVLVDYTRLRTALSDFFAGWISMMSALGQSESRLQDAHDIYNQTITQIFPEV